MAERADIKGAPNLSSSDGMKKYEQKQSGRMSHHQHHNKGSSNSNSNNSRYLSPPSSNKLWQISSDSDDEGGESTSTDPEELDFARRSFPPVGKRLAPVGANAEEDNKSKSMADELLQKSSSSVMIDEDSHELKEQIRRMELEQEELNDSLMSMTSHFAKVQLRLQQVVSAPTDKKEDLLKELEHFAFRGIPNVSSAPRIETAAGAENAGLEEEAEEQEGGNEEKENHVDEQQQKVLDEQRKKHADLIQQLKGQLEELESYAYESGEAIVPSNMLLERQRIVMEQLKSRLNLNMDNIVKLSEEELKAEVDSAVGSIVNPLKMKSHLVNQLMTQINDLEMFIQFLQRESSTMAPTDCQDCGCSKHAQGHDHDEGHDGGKKQPHHHRRKRTQSEQEEIHNRTVNILQKAMAVLQLTAVSQFGCGGGLGSKEQFYKNTLKQTPKGNHYGDLRARLEVAVDHMLDACSQVESKSTCSDADESQPEYLMRSTLLNIIVRRELTSSIRDLMQHGLCEQSRGGVNLVPFLGCMSGRRNRGGGPLDPENEVKNVQHAWDIVLYYYNIKRGKEFNAAPQRKLSQSFGLDLTGGGGGGSGDAAGTNHKQTLLTAVGQIISSHGLYKRSPDAHFKAFICAGLNKRKLIPWLKLLLRNQAILETFYQPWSYVIKTGFDDAFRALERLSIYVFDLPVDAAVKQFQDMSEAF